MKIHQISVFVENKPGRLAVPCKLLADAGINIVTLSLSDTEQFGILRLIVHDWQRAREVLQSAGMVVNVTEVVAVEVPDHVGGLVNVLGVMEQAGINVDYMYAFTEKSADKAVLVFRLEDPDAAVDALTNSGISLISNVDVCKQINRT